jgi:Capsule assembly protein Wzi/PAP2 superfamily
LKIKVPLEALTFLVICFLLVGAAEGQVTSEAEPNASVSQLNKDLFKHVLEDQRNIWTSPLRSSDSSARWLIPVAGITTGLILTDRITQPEFVRKQVSTANSFSNYAVAGYAAGVGALYLEGWRTNSPKQKETAVLAGEAAVNSVIVGEALKYAFLRDRPYQGDGTGHFFRSGGSSFYSVHSTVAWSIASIIAREYPGWLTKGLAYGGAASIGLARVAANQHFPSDVFVGAVAGYMIGRQVYHDRHNPNVEANYGTFVKQHPEWSSSNAGSTYLPLDSWVYPALQRLFAAGYIRNQFLGLRPWTRTAISSMLTEAEQRMSDDDNVSPELQSVFANLRAEFADEAKLGLDFDNQAINLDAVYTRSTYISGMPINDSYHFGQTIINDFGRPYQEGWNQIAGFSARAEQGHFSYYFRGEYQHAPGAPAYSLPVRQLISQVDVTPLQPAVAVPETNTFRIIDGYAGLTMWSNFISVGKQSVYWGPDQGGAMIMSDNSVPFYMVRLDRVTPFQLPWIFKYLGPFRYDAFFGQLENHRFPPRAYMHGEKISLKPTENLEFGFSRTAVFSGEGVSPLTFGVFWKSLTSATSSTTAAADPRLSPGVRHGQFDFSYRVPFVRKWVTVYSDGLVHDDVSPIDAPRRAAWNPGVYVSHFPKLDKLDLRIESADTDASIPESNGGHFFYYESIYRDVYLNGGYANVPARGTLMGSWIGREGKGIQAWSTYWLNPMSTIQFGYRHAKVSKDFIPGGETFNDYSVQAKIRLRPELELSSFLQYERWTIPVFAADQQSNFTTSVQLTFWPKRLQLASRREN